MQNRTALVSGASSGIGRELTKLLAKDCSTLVLVARSQDRLQGLKQELEKNLSNISKGNRERPVESRRGS